MFAPRVPTTTTEYEAELKRFASIFEDKRQREELLATTGDDAQKWLDLLQLLSDYPGVETVLRSVMLKIMIRLSRRTSLHPRCLIIPSVERLGDHPVGGGAFGDVWKAKIGEEIVCMKVLRVYTASELKQILKDFMQEAIVWRQLNHGNLLPFLGVYYLDSNMNRLCLISPWMERGNLLQFMKNSPELVDHGKLAHDVACGLSHLHGLKIVHSDLKGVNILITLDLRACVGDFGLSRVSDTQRLFSSQTTHSKGTTRWLSPELLRPGPDCIASKASDVYAYGCVCYEIYTGRIPFHEMTDAAVIFAVVMDKIHPTRPGDSPALTNAVWDTMVTCWNPEPSSRPTIVDVLARVRQYFLSNSSGPPHRDRRGGISAMAPAAPPAPTPGQTKAPVVSWSVLRPAVLGLKSSVALPVADAVTAASVKDGGMVQAKKRLPSVSGPSSGGYRPKGRPQDAELEDDMDTEDSQAMQISSVAQQKLTALAGKRNAAKQQQQQRRASGASARPEFSARAVTDTSVELAAANASFNPAPIQIQRTRSQVVPGATATTTAPLPLGYPYNLPLAEPPSTPRTTSQLMLWKEMSESVLTSPNHPHKPVVSPFSQFPHLSSTTTTPSLASGINGSGGQSRSSFSSGGSFGRRSDVSHISVSPIDEEEVTKQPQSSIYQAISHPSARSGPVNGIGASSLSVGAVTSSQKPRSPPRASTSASPSSSLHSRTKHSTQDPEPVYNYLLNNHSGSSQSSSTRLSKQPARGGSEGNRSRSRSRNRMLGGLAMMSTHAPAKVSDARGAKPRPRQKGSGDAGSIGGSGGGGRAGPRAAGDRGRYTRSNGYAIYQPQTKTPINQNQNQNQGQKQLAKKNMFSVGNGDDDGWSDEDEDGDGSSSMSRSVSLSESRSRSRSRSRSGCSVSPAAPPVQNGAQSDPSRRAESAQQQHPPNPSNHLCVPPLTTN